VSGVRAGEICLTAFLAGGVIARVAIAADRPVSLASGMAGRSVGAVAEAVAALHGLCGQSHAAAVHFAAAASLGATVPAVESERWMVRLAGERLVEHLRGVFLTDGLSAEGLAGLRVAVGVGQVAARSGAVSSDDLGRVAAALAALVAVAREGLDRIVAGITPGHGGAADGLSVADDGAVIAALAGDIGFIRAPWLPGRVAETGPAARRGCSAADPVAARAARLAEVLEAAALLGEPGAGRLEDWISAGSAGVNTGYAAVETPRGRLYYRLVLGAGGQVREARVLAPTEWNFHPDGPAARALVGFRPGAEAVAAIARRAAAFDPCVALRVCVADA
jgi:hypothetical protein